MATVGAERHQRHTRCMLVLCRVELLLLLALTLTAEMAAKKGAPVYSLHPPTMPTLPCCPLWLSAARSHMYMFWQPACTMVYSTAPHGQHACLQWFVLTVERWNDGLDGSNQAVVCVSHTGRAAAPGRTSVLQQGRHCCIITIHGVMSWSNHVRYTRWPTHTANVTSKRQPRQCIQAPSTQRAVHRCIQ